MRRRSITFDDLKTCLEIFPEVFAGVLVFDHQRVWRARLAHPSFRGVIIEEEGDAREWKELGSGASVFIRDDVARKEIDGEMAAEPCPIQSALRPSAHLSFAPSTEGKSNGTGSENIGAHERGCVAVAGHSKLRDCGSSTSSPCSDSTAIEQRRSLCLQEFEDNT